MFGKKNELDDEICELIKQNMYYVPECSRIIAEHKGISLQEAEKIVKTYITSMRKKYGSRVYNSQNNNSKESQTPPIATCPKCGSQSITTTNKKISIGKGVAGAAIGAMVNPVGTVVGGAVGATHSKKIYNVCMNCGHKWKP